MNAVVQQQVFLPGQIAPAFQGVAANNDLSGGVQAGYGHIGIKGKVWSTRFRGEEKVVMRPDGDGPANSITVVILKASPVVSKIWYEAGYVEGSSAPPDCFSTNGVTPDVGAAKKQCATCAACPKNAWGSRITPEGKQGKACSDSKRLAVVPDGDLRNEAYGGPMLLRVPAASLQDLAGYGNKMAALGYPYFAVTTRISFDVGSAFPKFVFGAVRALTNEEAQIVLELQASPEVARILAETIDHQPAAAAPQGAAPAQAFEQPPGQVPPAQAQPTATGAVQASPVVTQASPVVTQATPQQPANYEADLDAQLEQLIGN